MTLADELERLGKLATEGPIYTDSLGYIPGANVTDLHTREARIAEFVPKNDAELIVALVNNLPAIIAALRAQEWQPIETAPRDGRRALVYRPLAQNSNDDPVDIKCLIQTDNGCWDSTVPPGAEPCNPTDGYCHVTHWMPLPTPPAHDKGEP